MTDAVLRVAGRQQRRSGFGKHSGKLRALWPLTLFPALVVVVVVLPFVADLKPDQMDLLHTFQPPVFFGGSFSHVLGTDDLGRDVAARVVLGARVSLEVSTASVALALIIGVPVGFAAAMARRWVTTILLRVIDVQLAFPYILLALFVVAVISPSLPLLIALLALPSWVYVARLVRSQVLVENAKTYSSATRLLGVSERRLALKYMLPEIRPVVTVAALNLFANMIVLEATLDFLGMGIQPPTPSLGSMMFGGLEYLTTGWWISITPGFVILILVGSLFRLMREVERRLDAEAAP